MVQSKSGSSSSHSNTPSPPQDAAGPSNASGSNSRSSHSSRGTHNPRSGSRTTSDAPVFIRWSELAPQDAPISIQATQESATRRPRPRSPEAMPRTSQRVPHLPWPSLSLCTKPSMAEEFRRHSRWGRAMISYPGMLDPYATTNISAMTRNQSNPLLQPQLRRSPRSYTQDERRPGPDYRWTGPTHPDAREGWNPHGFLRQ